MYSNIMQTECCICFNDIKPDDVFILECCNNQVHNTCIVNWIKSSIDNKFADYNKCILCKKYNKSINDSYRKIKLERKKMRNNNSVIIVINDQDSHDNDDNLDIITDNHNNINNVYEHRFYVSRKIIICCSNAIYFTIVLFSSYVVLDIFIKLSHL